MRFNVSGKSLVSLLLLASISACGQKTKTRTVENQTTMAELEKSQVEAKKAKADNASLVAQQEQSKADKTALEAAKAEALAAKAAAEAARAAAEADRVAALEGKATAAADKAKAEAALKNAEVARATAEAALKAAEVAQKAAEDAMANAESDRATAEAAKKAAEAAKIVADEARKAAEIAAEAAGVDRATAEAARKAAEAAQATAEAAKITAETARAAAEVAAAAAEGAKKSAEDLVKAAKEAADSARTKQEEKSSVLKYMKNKIITLNALEDTLKGDVDNKTTEIGEKATENSAASGLELALLNSEIAVTIATTALGQATADLQVFQTNQDKLQETIEAKTPRTDFENDALKILKNIKDSAALITHQEQVVTARTEALALKVKSLELEKANLDSLKDTMTDEIAAAQKRVSEATLAKESAEKDLEEIATSLTDTKKIYQNTVALLSTFSGEIVTKLLVAQATKESELVTTKMARKSAEDKLAQAKVELSDLQNLQKFAASLLAEVVPVTSVTSIVE